MNRYAYVLNNPYKYVDPSGQVAVLINKMDTVDYKEDAYKKAVEDVSAVLKQAGFKVEEITFIAASGLKGDNVAKKSENMPWYTGKTLLEQLDELKEPEKPTDLPLRLPIQDVYNITGIGVVPAPINPVTFGVFLTTYQESSVTTISYS